MSLYNDKRISWLKRVFPEGTRICLEKMVDDPYPVEPNTLGTVGHVDDAGTIHCNFDNGRSLGVIYGVDKFHIVREGE